MGQPTQRLLGSDCGGCATTQSLPSGWASLKKTGTPMTGMSEKANTIIEVGEL